MSQSKKETHIHISLERIKRVAVTAMFSDDELMDVLVLKGGNAMALVHKLTSRESVDIDFSMREDFPEEASVVQKRIQLALQRTFRTEGYEPFDFKMAEKPATISPELASFWGGYSIEFKLVASPQFSDLKDNLPALRKAALNIGQGQKFFIDISRYEYIDDRQADHLDGYRIYVYSPLMIACEKLRAICQQMEEYAPIVKRDNRPGSQRARDFLDIHTLVGTLSLDMHTPQALDMLTQMFAIKHVDTEWLGLINNYREFHRQGFPSVKDTVAPDFDLQPFDFYVDYVAGLANAILCVLQKSAAATPPLE